jgi:hypothetical protein
MEDNAPEGLSSVTSSGVSDIPRLSPKGTKVSIIYIGKFYTRSIKSNYLGGGPL